MKWKNINGKYFHWLSSVTRLLHVMHIGMHLTLQTFLKDFMAQSFVLHESLSFVSLFYTTRFHVYWADPTTTHTRFVSSPLSSANVFQLLRITTSAAWRFSFHVVLEWWSSRFSLEYWDSRTGTFRIGSQGVVVFLPVKSGANQYHCAIVSWSRHILNFIPCFVYFRINFIFLVGTFDSMFLIDFHW